MTRLTEPDTTVVGLNLSDLTPDGTSDPLGALLLDLCTTAARLVQSDTETVGAMVSLAALRSAVAEGLPETAALVGHVLELLDLTADLTKKETPNVR